MDGLTNDIIINFFYLVKRVFSKSKLMKEIGNIPY